jgi:hypothetical protein
MKKNIFFMLLIVLVAFLISGCYEETKSSDKIQQDQQEQILKEATASTGMPNIKNFREKKFAKMLLELRDQEGVATYAYLYCEFTGKFTYLGECIGYGLPYAAQYTSPNKIELNERRTAYEYFVMPQADPNGLFSPASADATWIMLIDEKTGEAYPSYIESKVSIYRKKLPARIVQFDR